MPFEGLLNYEGADEEAYVKSLVKQIRTPVPYPHSKWQAITNGIAEIFGKGTAGAIEKNARARWALAQYVNGHEGAMHLDAKKREGILSLIRGEQNSGN